MAAGVIQKGRSPNIVEGSQIRRSLSSLNRKPTFHQANTAVPIGTAVFRDSYTAQATRSRTPRVLSDSTTTVSPSRSLPSMMSVERGSSTLSINVRLSDRTP